MFTCLEVEILLESMKIKYTIIHYFVNKYILEDIKFSKNLNILQAIVKVTYGWDRSTATICIRQGQMT